MAKLRLLYFPALGSLNVLHLSVTQKCGDQICAFTSSQKQEMNASWGWEIRSEMEDSGEQNKEEEGKKRVKRSIGEEGQQG